MSTTPSVTPELLADVLDALGRRPRARLDSDPHLGRDWPVTRTAAGFLVTVGEEVVVSVTVGDDGLTSLDQLACSCLVEGACLHLAAYLRQLPLRAASATGAASTETQTSPAPTAPAGDATPDAVVEVGAAARAAAELAWAAIGAVLVAGARRSGSLEVSQLLRAAQTCRAERLYRLERVLLAVVDSLGRLSRDESTFSLDELVGQLLEAARCSHHLRGTSAATAWFGSPRRVFSDLPGELVHGVGAELVDRPGSDPALRVHLWGRSGWSHLQTRPAPAAELAGSYRVGLGTDGSLPSPAELSRHEAQVVGAGRGRDGRLSGGSSLRIGLRVAASSASPTLAALWDEPVPEQVARALGGGSLVACSGEVAGATREGLVLDTATGPVVVVRPRSGGRARTNLAVLGSAVGLGVRTLGHPDRYRPRVLRPVSVLATDDARWQLPDAWARLVNLAFDELRATHVGASAVAPAGVEVDLPGDLVGGLEPLRRRVGQVVLGGWLAVRPRGGTATKDEGTLRRRGLGGAADALTVLAASPADVGELLTAWLAAALYADVARTQLLAASW